MRARSAATSSVGAPVRSRITCQRIDGSESSSHRMTGSCGWKRFRLFEFLVIRLCARSNALAWSRLECLYRTLSRLAVALVLAPLAFKVLTKCTLLPASLNPSIV